MFSSTTEVGDIAASFTVAAEVPSHEENMTDAQQEAGDADDGGPNAAGPCSDYGEPGAMTALLDIPVPIAGHCTAWSDAGTGEGSTATGSNGGSGSGDDEAVRTGGPDDGSDDDPAGSPDAPGIPEYGGDPTPDSDKEPVITEDKYRFGLWGDIHKVGGVGIGWNTPKDQMPLSIDMCAMLSMALLSTIYALSVIIFGSSRIPHGTAEFFTVAFAPPTLLMVTTVFFLHRNRRNRP